MNVQQRLPPTGRDFEAYRLVTVEQRSTRAVATELQISQTRVCQVVLRVGEYLLQVAPRCVTSDDRGRQVFVAQQIAAEQLKHLLGRAIQGFEQSIGEQTVVRKVEVAGKPQATVTTTRSSPGDCRYLNQAARFSLLAAKLPVANLAGLLPAESETGDGKANSSEIVEAELVTSPPVGACSPTRAEPTLEDREDELNDDASADDEEASDWLTPEEAEQWRAKILALRSVQLLHPIQVETREGGQNGNAGT